MEIAQTLALAAGLGLLGFLEPCSVGSHLIFVKSLEQRSGRERILQTVYFTLTRAGLMAALGVSAALLGAGLQGLQHAIWSVLGGLYVLLGLVYLGGGAPRIIRQTTGLLPRLSPNSSGVSLGAVFAFNIPACAVPLLALLLGDTAARAAAGAGAVQGGMPLLVFGLALSAPLVFVVFTRKGRWLLDAIIRLAGHMPRWTGVVFVILGLWSVALVL